MARQKRSQGEEDTAGPGAWIVTFSDCMTLLLCFFVLLLSFSSFEEIRLRKLAGALKCKTLKSISSVEREIKDSMIPPTDRPSDVTEYGSEAPTGAQRRSITYPKKLPTILDTEAYKDRRVLYLASSQLFWGKGSVLTPAGRGHLGMIAGFMRLAPCRVVVREGGPDMTEDRAETADTGLERAWAVVNYFAAPAGKGCGLPMNWFGVSARSSAPPTSFSGQRVVEIALLTRSALR